MTVEASVPAPAAATPDTASAQPAPASETSDGAATAPAAAQRKPIAREFTALAKKEQAIQREREALKAKEAEIAAREARARELEEKYGKKPESPLKALERYGYSYKDATEAQLAGDEPSVADLARQAAAEEAQRLRDELAAKEAAAKEAQKKELEDQAAQVITKFKSDINEFVKANADDYELVNHFDAAETVYGVIEEHFAKTGKVLSLKEAADLVETHLVEHVEKANSTKRIQAKRELGKPSEASARSTLEKPGQDTAQQHRTLNSSLSTSTPALVTSPQVEEDRMKRALAALK